MKTSINFINYFTKINKNEAFNHHCFALLHHCSLRTKQKDYRTANIKNNKNNNQ